MTRIYTDGAEAGDLLTAGLYIREQFSAIESTIKRSGAYSYKSATSTTGSLVFPAQAEYYIRAAIYVTNIGESRSKANQLLL